jgi:hypothetical protein
VFSTLYFKIYKFYTKRGIILDLEKKENLLSSQLLSTGKEMTKLRAENSQKTQETSEQKETIRVRKYMIEFCSLKILNTACLVKSRMALNIWGYLLRRISQYVYTVYQ